MRTLIACLILAASAWAQPTNLRLVRATHQQLVPGYNAPSSNACTIDLRDPDNVQAHDVNQTLYTDANLDSAHMPSELAGGRYRQPVLGKRKYATALDGKRYSLSLQAFITYTLTVTCDGSSVSIPVSTRNTPFGHVLDEFPYDDRPGMEGYYGYATLDHTNRLQKFIDASTGLLISKITMPGDYFDETAPSSYTIGTVSDHANWTGEANITGTADGSVASTTSTDWLFIPRGGSGSSDDYLKSMDIRLTGQISGATGEDAKVETCLCNSATGPFLSDIQEFSLSTSGIAATTFGDGGVAFSGKWLKGKSHIVEGFFAPALKPIGDCVRKKTDSGHTLEIDAFAFINVISADHAGNNTSLPAFTAIKQLTDVGSPNSDFLLSYYPDRASGGGRMYSFDVVTGASTYLGPLRSVFAFGGLDTFSLSSVLFDKADGRVFYAARVSSTGGNVRLVKCSMPTTSGYLTTNFTSNWLTMPTFFHNTWCDDITTAGYTIDEQADNFGHPAHGVGSYWAGRNHGFWRLESILSTGHIVFRGTGSQAIGGWVAVFDLNSTPSGAPAGTPKLVGLSAFGPGDAPDVVSPVLHRARKGCIIHTTNSVDSPGWMSVGCARQFIVSNTETQSSWGGPWQIQVRAVGGGAILSSGISGGQQTFEVMTQGTCNYDWADQFTSTGTTLDDCFKLEVGDSLTYVASGIDNTDWSSGAERMEIVSIDDSTTPRKITVRRGPGIVNSPWLVNSGFSLWDTNAAVASIAEGTRLYLVPSASSLSWKGLANISWKFDSDPHGMVYVQPATDATTRSHPPSSTTPVTYTDMNTYSSPNFHSMYAFGDHGTHALGIKLQYTSGTQVCPRYYSTSSDVCYAVQTLLPGTPDQQNTAITRKVGIEPYWAGSTSAIKTAAYDTHLKLRQYDAPLRERDWVTDQRPVYFWTQTHTAVAAPIYRMDASFSSYDPKRFPLAGFSGDMVLRNVSGPAATSVTALANTPHSVCHVVQAGECYAGSTAGQVYVNIPRRTGNECLPAGTYGGFPRTRYGACVEDPFPHKYRVLQVDVGTDDYPAQRTRVLASAFVKPLVQTRFDIGHTTPRGDWVEFAAEDQGVTMWYAVKTPPLPPMPTRNNLTYERLIVDAYHPTAAKVRVEVGTEEYGSMTDYYMTSRREKCWVGSATVNDANPFQWNHEAATYVTLTSGRARIELPRVPGRILFARINYYDSMNTLIETKVLPPQ
jgi:hypothetical protein